MNLLPLSDFDCCLGISKAREDVVKLLLALFVFHFSLENCGCDDVAIRSKKCFILYPIVNWIISQAQVKELQSSRPTMFPACLAVSSDPCPGEEMSRQRKVFSNPLSSRRNHSEGKWSIILLFWKWIRLKSINQEKFLKLLWYSFMQLCQNLL